MTAEQKQCLLRYLGYYRGQVDGVWGLQSQRAMEEFQQAHGDMDLLRVVAEGETSWWSGIRHFRREEFRCPCGKCGGFPAEPERALVELADQVREHFGAAVTVSSGVRCQAHNDSLRGSVPNSRHVQGKAMDFSVRGKSAKQVLAYVQTLPLRYAYAIDEHYVHMDTQ